MAKKKASPPELEQKVFADEGEASLMFRPPAVNNESNSVASTRITQPESSSGHNAHESQWIEPQNGGRAETSNSHASVRGSFTGRAFCSPTNHPSIGERNSRNRDSASAANQQPRGDLDWTPLSPNIMFSFNQQLHKYANVYLGLQNIAGVSREIAIKLLKRSNRTVREARFLAQLEWHPNIVKILEFGEYAGLIPHTYICMELCLENLDQYVNRNPFHLRKATSFFEQTVSAIAHIHNHHIAHGDLKPSNILVARDRKSIKICDFGHGEEIPGDRSNVTVSNVGTVGFMAPESCIKCNAVCGYKADIYVLGINGYFIFTHGKHPFGSYSFDWVHNIVHNKNRDLSLVPVFPNASKTHQLVRLLEHMLQFDPRNRPTAAEVYQDDFFQDSLGDHEGQTMLRAKDATQTSVASILRSFPCPLEAHVADEMSVALVTAAHNLMESGVHAQDHHGVPETLSADDAKEIGKKLREKHPVCAVIMHRVAGLMYRPETVTPDKAVDWLSDQAADIRCTAERIMESTSGEARHVAVDVCPKYMQELLDISRKVDNASRVFKATCEASCIISISRITINAGNYPDVSPRPNIIDLCLEGRTRLRDVLGHNVKNYKYYGYLLNNIGEAYMQQNQLLAAEKFFRKALIKKREATYRSRTAQLQDIEFTENNLTECQDRIRRLES